MTFTLKDFVRESNLIEGIHGVGKQEVVAHKHFLSLDAITLPDLELFVAECAGAALRSHPGMNVRVGGHYPPQGGHGIETELTVLLGYANRLMSSTFAYQTHLQYENLHPFMDGNGRSGRALWLWMMGGIERAPLGFLHHFYYQTLNASDGRK